MSRELRLGGWEGASLFRARFSSESRFKAGGSGLGKMFKQPGPMEKMLQEL